jgi:tetratricopeptide (TPR) repeat protein
MAETKRVKLYYYDELTNNIATEYLDDLDEETSIQPIVYSQEQHIERARNFIAENNNFDAITELNSALDIGPETAEIHYLRCAALTNLNEYELADDARNKADFLEARELFNIDEFSKALEIFASLPENYEGNNIKLYIGYCLFELKKYDEAFEILNNNLSEAPTWHSFASTIYTTTGISPEIKLLYIDKAVSFHTNDPVLLTMKGLCFYDQKKYQEALETFDIALKHQPKDKEILINKYLMKAHLGHHEESVAFINKIIEKSPADINAHLMKARYLKIAGLKEEALQSCDYVIENLDKFSFDAWHFKINLFDLNKINPASKQNYEEILQVLKGCNKVLRVKNDDIEEGEKKTVNLINAIQAKIKTNLAKEIGFEFVYKVLAYREPNFLGKYTNWLFTLNRHNDVKSICEENINIEGFAKQAKVLLDRINNVPKPMLSPLKDSKRKSEEVIDKDIKGSAPPPCKKAKGTRLTNSNQNKNSPFSPFR